MTDALDLVRLLQSRAPTLGGSRLMAIDGPAGSGKTTMARDVARLLARSGPSVMVMSLDDLYDGWSGLNGSLAGRVVTQVLEPLRQGHAARWQAYDWGVGAFDGWQDLAPVDVLVLEGCGAGAAELTAYITVLVWMETDPDTAKGRMVARDGAEVLDHLTDWRALEESHFAANRTRERADVVIAT